MTVRSTRNKMKWQAEKIMKDLEKALRHCHDIELMAANESEYVNANLPEIVTLVDYMYKVVKTFREGL